MHEVLIFKGLRRRRMRHFVGERHGFALLVMMLCLGYFVFILDETKYALFGKKTFLYDDNRLFDLV